MKVAFGALSTKLTVCSSTFSIDLSSVRQARAVEVFVSAAGDLVVGMVLLPHALEAEDHVVGVEVARRREALGGLELDARAQMEGVLEPVVRDVPALGEHRAEVGGAVLELDQPVVDRARAASNVVPAVYSCGLKPSGLPSEQYTRVFWACASGASRAASASPTLPATIRLVIGVSP